MTTVRDDNRRSHRMITDLDQSDSAQPTTTAMTTAEAHRKTHKRRVTAKNLQTMSGNFNRRSRSAECTAELQEPLANNKKVNSYFNELLQTKDKQMEKLLQRLSTLHKFNEQFAEENQKLRSDAHTLNERIQRLQQQIEDCPECRKLTQLLGKYSTEKKTLSADIEMMKTLVYRLNVQIEGYQDQLRRSRETKSDGGGGGGSVHVVEQEQTHTELSIISHWREQPLHTHTLSPLLQSYDEMVRDKEQLIRQYRDEFEHFTGELKRILGENNKLLQQQETLKRDVGTWREERVRLQAQVDVCRKKAEAQTRKSDLAKEQLVEVMRCYEQKLQTLVLDMEHLEAAYTRCKSELAALKSLAAQPQDSIAQSLQECKQLLEQLRQQHSKEKQTLEQNITELTEQSRSSEARIGQLKCEKTALTKELEEKSARLEELQARVGTLQRATEKIKRSRDRLKARLRIALQWAQKLEEGQANIQSTWDALKRLESIVKHKESQVRGLHSRHLQEIDKMQKKLAQKEETIRKILKGKLSGAGDGPADR